MGTKNWLILVTLILSVILLSAKISYEMDVAYYENEGYSREAAKLIVNVEGGFMPANDEYRALMED